MLTDVKPPQEEPPVVDRRISPLSPVCPTATTVEELDHVAESIALVRRGSTGYGTVDHE